MSTPKKYYWLKLKEDFFDDETIRYIEEQPNGILYSNFYLKLCLKSLKYEGRLIRVVGETLIPYDAKALARLTGADIDTVRCAMAIFQQIGIVKVLESGELYLSQVEEMVGKETDKAAAMRRIRAERKENPDGVTMLPECYPEIEIEIEKDIEIEKETEAAPRIPYIEIQTMYNEICKSYSRCTKLSDARKKAIKARFAQGYTLDDFRRLFQIAESSSFLKGQNQRNWSATFDWLLKDSNMAKVLDGNYGSQIPTKPAAGKGMAGSDKGPATGNMDKYLDW